MKSLCRRPDSQLVERFRLSERSFTESGKMARTGANQARELTRGDADAFSEELLGVNMDQVKEEPSTTK